MIRLSIASLRRDGRAVFAPLLLMTAAAVLMSIALHCLWSSITPDGARAIAEAPEGTPGALISVSVFLIVLGLGVPIAVCISIVSSLAIRESESVYASWRLAGASPNQVRVAVRMRSMISASVAGICGYLISLPLLQPAVGFLVSSTDIEVDLRVQLGPVPFLALVLLLWLLTAIGSSRPAKRAANVKPIVLFVEPLARSTHVRVRGVFAGILASVVIALGVVALGTDQTSDRAMLAIFVGFALIVCVTLGAPVILPPLVRLWTAFPGLSGIPAWYLARHQVQSKLSTTTAAVIPLTIAASMIGAYFSVLGTWEAVVGRGLSGGSANVTQGIVLFGPGALLALLAAACNLFTVGRLRERYEGTLRAVGVSRRTARDAGMLEALIYAVTALIVGVLVSCLSSLLIAIPAAVSGDGFHLVVDVRWLLLIVFIGFIPLALSIQLPIRAASRQSLGIILSK
ncbi:FtsX-like permease family protein [Plantibacter sp. YIM 135347]|uniref:FtsX-like permease family protein n=1 Tax=Plantibacter sp. YIM 135347 TaxID=3423919 RepID=UPI003D328195